MTNPLAINLALERHAELDGMPVELEGILVSHTEGYELVHYPASERTTQFVAGETDYRPCVWLAFGNGSLQPNHAALTRWCGKRVRVHGIFRSVVDLLFDERLGTGGFGPWGFWPVEIEPFVLQRVSSSERKENHGTDAAVHR